MTTLPHGGLSPRQLEFMRGSTGRVNILEGAIRSGKTVVALLRWLAFVIHAPRGGELLMVGRTRDSVWRNMIAPLQNPTLFGPVARLVVGNIGASTITVLGRRVWIMGASDAKAEKVLRGLTVAGACVDEVTTIPEAFFTQLLGRMSVPGAHLFGTTNPDNPAHWLRRRFLDRLTSLPDWTAWHFTLEDNPTLTDEYKTAIRAEFTGLWYRRYIRGEWVAAEGAVYDMWDPTTMVLPSTDLPAMDRLIALGIDHGVTNPSAGILLGIADGLLYAVDEWWLDGSTMQAKPTTAAQSASLRTWLADRAPAWTVVDPAAAAFRAQLADDGLHGLAPADNEVAWGISLVANLLATGRLQVADTCTNLIRELPGYAWDPKATEQGKDTPLKIGDHALDALRYALATTENTWRRHLAPPRGE